MTTERMCFFNFFSFTEPVGVLFLHMCFFFLLFQGITFDEFRSFFQFLNNLEDFAIAMQMYNFASRSIGQGEWRAVIAGVTGTGAVMGLFLLSHPLDEFARAVYVATGLKLTRHLVHTIFKIFDVDHDDQLSYKEFIGIMKDRLHRGARVRNFVISVKRNMKVRLCQSPQGGFYWYLTT